MRVSRISLILIVSLVVAVAGTVAAADIGGNETAVLSANRSVESEAATVDQFNHTLSDPQQDRLGWEGGYWYNESIDVDQSSGLTRAELQRYKFRTMARLEKIRGLEFTEDIEIEFIGPDEVAERTSGNVTQFRGSDQQWEALFVVGEDRDTDRVVFETLAGRVAGWAAEEGSETVVLITDDPDEPTAPPTLIAHELAHVLQHQQFDLDADRYQRATLDGEHAKDALIEGEASYLDRAYSRHCLNGSWDCVDGGSFTTGQSDLVESDLLPHLRAPYTSGSEYVGRLIDQGGLDAVDTAHLDPPEYSVTALHGEQAETARRAGIAPTSPLSVPDRSTGDWMRRDEPDRIGAMGLKAMIGDIALTWRNGALYPYTNGSADGFVWETHWSNETTAAAFADAYRDRIRSTNSTRVTDTLWEIRDGPFADVFAINRTGNVVRIVNAPSVEALSAAHSGTAPTISAQETPTASAVDTETADGDGSGFEVATALTALFAVVLAKRKAA